jgi:hypothetical protein
MHWNVSSSVVMWSFTSILVRRSAHWHFSPYLVSYLPWVIHSDSCLFSLSHFFFSLHPLSISLTHTPLLSPLPCLSLLPPPQHTHTNTYCNTSNDPPKCVCVCVCLREACRHKKRPSRKVCHELTELKHGQQKLTVLADQQVKHSSKACHEFTKLKRDFIRRRTRN